MKGTVTMSTHEETAQANITALLEQVTASKAAAENETDDQKVARAIQKAAKMLEDALSYETVWKSEDDRELPKQLGTLKTAVTRLQTVGTLVSPVAVFDRSVGAALAGKVKLAESAAEAGYLSAEIGKAAAEAVAQWATVKGGGSSGPRASKGAGDLGYQLLISREGWDKPLSDSTGKGSAMSSALRKHGKTLEPQIDSAKEDNWKASGLSDHSDLSSAIEAVLAGEESSTVGDWTVTAANRKVEEVAAA